jgi:hypothetical protein
VLLTAVAKRTTGLVSRYLGHSSSRHFASAALLDPALFLYLGFAILF